MATQPAKPTDPPYRVIAHEVFQHLPGARAVHGDTQILDPKGSVWTIKRVAGDRSKLSAHVMWDELNYSFTLKPCLCCEKAVISYIGSRQPEAVANQKNEPNLVLGFPIEIRKVMAALIWNLAKEAGLVE
jgi:hypothetical protein